jgi:hypothetical protein
MVGASFVQGEADIYTNPPANYTMYPRKAPKVAVEEHKRASVASTASTVQCESMAVFSMPSSMKRAISGDELFGMELAGRMA